MTNLIEIKTDLFDIAWQLRRIDDGYRIFYNPMLSRYEVHNLSQKLNTLCLVVPYDCLDARTLRLVYATRVQNAEKLFKEIEENNEKLEAEQNRRLLASAAENLLGR